MKYQSQFFFPAKYLCQLISATVSLKKEYLQVIQENAPCEKDYPSNLSQRCVIYSQGKQDTQIWLLI